MKDSVLNLLVFLLVFVVTVLVFLGTYSVSLILVPGGRGLVFANPFAGALFPSLLAGLVVAQFRSVRKPGVFAITWSLLALAFLFLLSLSIPVIQSMPALRPANSTPLISDRFLALADGSSLLSTGKATVLIPPEKGIMSVVSDAQFDPLNQRFVFSSGDPKALGSTSPEKGYFQYTPALSGLQTDFLAIYLHLRDNSTSRPVTFWFETASVSGLFLGMFFFFSLRTWPLIHVVLVLLLMRLGVMFVVYAFWGLPALVDLWSPPTIRPALSTWAPVVLIAVAAASLFFMTWVSKPWKQEALA